MTNWDKYVVNGDDMRALGDLEIYSDENETNVVVVDDEHDIVVFRDCLYQRSWLDFLMDFVRWLREDNSEATTWQQKDGVILNKYDKSQVD